MAKMKLQVEGLAELSARISKLGGDVKQIGDKALRKTHEIVTQKAERGIDKENLPAKGRYSTGDTLKSLQRNAHIEWQGDVGSVEVGFDIENGGLPSVFLMHGTPKMKKDKALYDAFYGAATIQVITEAQMEIFYDEIRRLEG